ncbi:hypothetical protein BC829DRAFT_439341 [Chytridium lagenaria]|nr:hypothetical protein BC829DRAFT_439341 [Chytridium lagenaria]
MKHLSRLGETSSNAEAAPRESDHGLDVKAVLTIGETEAAGREEVKEEVVKEGETEVVKEDVREELKENMKEEVKEAINEEVKEAINEVVKEDEATSATEVETEIKSAETEPMPTPLVGAEATKPSEAVYDVIESEMAPPPYIDDESLQKDNAEEGTMEESREVDGGDVDPQKTSTDVINDVEELDDVFNNDVQEQVQGDDVFQNNVEEQRDGDKEKSPLPSSQPSLENTFDEPAILLTAQEAQSNSISSDISTWLRKPFLGGYRNRETGIEYFNATSQTPTPQEVKAMGSLDGAPKFHRDTQTKFLRNRRTQTTRETSTQMGRSDLHVTTEPDYTLTPRPYFTSEQHQSLLIKMATRIQCFIRKCFAKRLVKKLREERDTRLRLLAGKDRRRRELAEKRRRKEIESRLHPKSVKDFEILYNGLENWRIQETDKIMKRGYSEPARLAALADLLDQEAALIKKSIARELRDLYHALNLAKLTIDERLQILLHVKYTVKEFDCNLTREIVELIDREGDLVSRGREAKSLEDQFPGAGQAWKRDQSVYYCRSCTKYKPSTDFYLSTTMSHLGRCKPCTLTKTIAHTRQDDTLFSSLLQTTRLQELSRDPPPSTHYNASPSSRKAICGTFGVKNVEELVLTRWDTGVEISPWNCVLMTKVEADSHERGGLDMYSDEFVRKVAQKHLAARRHFAQLPAMEKYLRRCYVEDREGRLVPKPGVM